MTNLERAHHCKRQGKLFPFLGILLDTCMLYKSRPWSPISWGCLSTGFSFAWYLLVGTARSQACPACLPGQWLPQLPGLQFFPSQLSCLSWWEDSSFIKLMENSEKGDPGNGVTGSMGKLYKHRWGVSLDGWLLQIKGRKLVRCHEGYVPALPSGPTLNTVTFPLE